jgi:FkbM family methyltransferase
MFSLYDLLAHDPPRINIVDVGAMSLGGVAESYDPIIERGVAKVIGFEPVKEECDKLNKQNRKNCIYLPYVIGDGSARTFYQCNRAMTSSLYEPYTELLDKFQNLANLMHVVSTSEVRTHCLDDVAEISDTDLLKLDVQGAELDVLRGAPNTLKDAVVVQVEVEFIPLYKEQPLFSDVDQLMRENGFLLHQFANIASRVFKPLIIDNNVNAPGSQMLWADAIYIKDFMRLDKLPPKKLLKLAIILHDIYVSLDTCAHVLQCYERKTNDGLGTNYMQRLVHSK